MSKNNEKATILLAPRFFQILSGKHILLDNSVFIDATNHSQAFFELFAQMKQVGAKLVTVDQVAFEFTKGGQSKDVVLAKREQIAEIVELSNLPIRPEVYSTLVPDLIERYGEIGKAISITDLLLAGVLQSYRNDMLLLTKNPRDFPSSVFTLQSHLILQTRQSLHIYGVFGYNVE